MPFFFQTLQSSLWSNANFGSSEYAAGARTRVAGDSSVEYAEKPVLKTAYTLGKLNAYQWGMHMSLAEWLVFVWFLFTVIPPMVYASLGAARILLASKRDNRQTAQNLPIMDILVPIKGVLPNQEKILESLLRQDYPSYNVIFLVESEEDPAGPIVDTLSSRFANAGKVITGPAGLCGQKNHNLVQGTKHLSPSADVIVFCDSSNMVDADWLTRFTEPVRTGGFEVVTTFRAFDPRPATIWGICQAIYAAFLLLLIANKPKPWGGATAITRSAFQRLDVTGEWSHNVIDDLALGNILDKAGIPVFLDPKSLLRSPLPNQSLSGLIDYLDRQILFPKWTNPIIWFIIVVFQLSLTAATVGALIVVILFSLGLISPVLGWSSYCFFIVIFAAAVLFWSMNPFRIPIWSWLISYLPFIFVTAFVLSRSVFRDHIDWHGKRYYLGKGGVVLSVEEADSPNGLDPANQ
jgi:ceramide glucosyltransferase